MDTRGAAGVISGIITIAVIAIIVVLVLPLESSEVPPVDGSAQVEAAYGIDTELVDCLFATSRGFLEYSSGVSPYRKTLNADLAITYAKIVCENDYRLSH